MGDQRQVERQGVGGNPEVVGADRPANRTQVGTELAVLPRDLCVDVHHLDGAEQRSQGGPVFHDMARLGDAPLEFAQHDDRDAALVQRQSWLESVRPLPCEYAGIRVEHGSQSNGSLSSSGK